MYIGRKSAGFTLDEWPCGKFPMAIVANGLEMLASSLPKSLPIRYIHRYRFDHARQSQ